MYAIRSYYESKNEEEGMLVPHITANELIEKQKQGDSSFFLLDVREPVELREELGHIEGITNIPLGSLPIRIHELDAKKEQPILVVCRSGARAEVAAGFMRKNGFNKVQVLKGGMLEYRRIR